MQSEIVQTKRLIYIYLEGSQVEVERFTNEVISSVEEVKSKVYANIRTRTEPTDSGDRKGREL